MNSGIEMRASRQKGVWSHLSAGQYPWEAIVIFFPAFVHKAVLDYKQAFHQLLSVYSLGGGTTVPEIWWPHGSGKGVLGGTEGSGNSADSGGGGRRAVDRVRSRNT